MSASNRPTFNPAKATEAQGGYKRYVPSHTQSVYLLPSHTVLKSRQIGQGSEEEIKQKDLKKELQEREKQVQQKKKNNNNQTTTTIQAIEYEKKDDIPNILEELEKSSEETKVKTNNDDSDEDLNSSSDDSDSDDSDSENDELIKELERVRREKEERERFATQERALTSNPLLRPITSKKDQDEDSSFTVKRKWTDSTIFKNQSNEKQQKKKRFINDTTRNDYHKQFMYDTMK